MPNPNLPINYRKNTYIGARYVPKFSDTPGSEWDNSIQYEPLTIVVYQGNSYTSKTFVPVGVDINNDTYWAQSGNYNAQVEEYRQEVKELKNDVEANTTAISATNTNLSNFKESLKTGLVAIGNSYLQGGIFNLLTPYYDYAILRQSDGAGFSTYAGHSVTYGNLFEDAIAAITNKNIITDILFLSAWGDTRALAVSTTAYQETLNSELAAIQTLAKSNFPNLKNMYIAYGEARNFTNQANPNTPMWAYYRTHQVFLETCYKYGFKYLGCTGWELMSTDNFLSDGYHPNSNGNVYIKNKIIQRMQGYDEYTPLRFNSSEFQFVQDGVNKTTGEISLQMTPEFTSLMFSPHTTGTVNTFEIVLSDANPTFIKIAPLMSTGAIDSFYIGNVRCVVQCLVTQSKMSFTFSEEFTLDKNFIYNITLRQFKIV